MILDTTYDKISVLSNLFFRWQISSAHVIQFFILLQIMRKIYYTVIDQISLLNFPFIDGHVYVSPSLSASFIFHVLVVSRLKWHTIFQQQRINVKYHNGSKHYCQSQMHIRHIYAVINTQNYLACNLDSQCYSVQEQGTMLNTLISILQTEPEKTREMQ